MATGESSMLLHEWCIGVLKGHKKTFRLAELYDLCSKRYQGALFGSEKEMLAALKPYSKYFLMEDYKYDYVTFEDDGQKDQPVLEQAKEVLRSHYNRYTLEVLCGKLNEDEAKPANLTERKLKNLLSKRDCFKIESRSITLIKLSPKGEASKIDPIKFRKPSMKEEDGQTVVVQKTARKAKKQKDPAREQAKLLRKTIIERNRERKRKRKQTMVERKEEHRVKQLKRVIDFYQITDDTTLEHLWTDGLIKEEDCAKSAFWGLHTVGHVYGWVNDRIDSVRLTLYGKQTVQRMLKIASFHDPELVRRIPKVKFSGTQKANRGMKLIRKEKKQKKDK